MRKVMICILVLFSSSVYGQSGWIQINTDFLNGSLINELCFSNNLTGYLIGNSGTFAKTLNGGYNWTIETNNIGRNFNSISVTNDFVYIVSDSGWVYKSSDYGSSWDSLKLNSNEELKLINFNSKDSGMIIADNAYSGNNIYSFFTSNGGINWITNFVAQENYINSNRSYNKYFLISGRQYGPFQYIFTVRKSYNMGLSWDVIVSNNLADYYDVSIYENKGLLSRRSQVLNTTNGGATWNSSILGFWRDSKVELLTENIGYAIPTVSVSGGINGAKTTDGGLSWNYFITGISSMQDMYFINPNTGFIFGNDTLLLTTNGAGFPTSLNNTGIETPSSFSLHQNYPNPFNPSTKIKFDIPKGSQVRLKVYDLLGREVAELVNEKLNAGVYEYVWNGAGLPSGVYFYKLEAGGFLQTRRMVLVK
jgi:photosystem II stability/assembly factor-like uncharacterized protein